MPNLAIRILIHLDKGEGRARHILNPPDPREARLNDRTGEMGFAWANMPIEQNCVARTQTGRKGFAQTGGCLGIQ
jgi:hypothetical protein